MKKVLFLSRSYPEIRRSATVLCTHRVMECIVAHGRYEVHTLCYQYDGEDYRELVNDIYVHRFKPSKWIWWRNRLRDSQRYCRWNRIMEVIQKSLTIPFFPQIEPITARKYRNEAYKLHRAIGFDLVVSEHHTLSTLLTGCWLMKEFGVKHVAIFWDPLKGQIATVRLPNSYTDRRIQCTEEFVAKFTTLQISTESMREYHKSQGDIAADHRIYLDIPSVLRPELEVPTGYLRLFRGGAINIVFSGLLSVTHRDPRPIIRLLNQTDYAKRINLLFFSMGANETLNEASKDFIGTIVVHDYIPLCELHTLYRHADYLLNVSHINPNMVPSKIFEYMSYGKPIISTFVSDGDAAEKYIKRYPEGLCIDLRHKEKDNIVLLNNFLLKEHKQIAFEAVKDMYKNNTPERFLEVIEKTICTHQ